MERSEILTAMAELKLRADPQQFLLLLPEGREPADAIKALADKPLPKRQAQARAGGMMRSPAMRDALARARATLADRAETTVFTLVERLERITEAAMACDPPQMSAAVAATMGIGKLLGLVVDRSQLDVVHHKPSRVPTQQVELSADEWKRQFHAEP